MTRIAHIEHAEKAHDSAIFVVEDLQAMLKTADAVQALVLLPLIAEASELRNRINGLRLALKHGRPE